MLHTLADLCNNQGCANDCRRAKNTTIFLKIAHFGDFVQKLFSDFFSSPTNLAAVHSWRVFTWCANLSLYLSYSSFSPSYSEVFTCEVYTWWVYEMCHTTSDFPLSFATSIHIDTHNTLTHNALYTALYLFVRRVVGTFYAQRRKEIHTHTMYYLHAQQRLFSSISRTLSLLLMHHFLCALLRDALSFISLTRCRL